MGEEKKPQSLGVWPTVKPFVNGGASGMLATCVIQPIDMIKVRIQLGQGSAGEVTRNMIKNEGFGALYKGLSAGLLRQATYTTARLGTFKILTNKAIEANDGKPLPLYQKALCGLTAGAIGASVGSPADLALIRMQADATLPAAQRRNYSNAFNALYRIVADEGVLALWKGAGPTVVRAMALNMGMLASYDQSVEFCKDSLGFGEAATVLGASSVSIFNRRFIPFIPNNNYDKSHEIHDKEGFQETAQVGSVWPGFGGYDLSSLRDRTKDILSVVVALLFGVGCGALTAATMYLVWSFFSPSQPRYSHYFDGDFSDDEEEDVKKIGYVKIPEAEQVKSGSV